MSRIAFRKRKRRALAKYLTEVGCSILAHPCRVFLDKTHTPGQFTYGCFCGRHAARFREAPRFTLPIRFFVYQKRVEAAEDRLRKGIIGQSLKDDVA